MAEYIERKSVSNACYAVFENVVRYPKVLTAGEVRETLLRFEKAINSVPAADVAPVVHGRWEETVENWVACSICGDEWNGAVVPYENCGARMDGE